MDNLQDALININNNLLAILNQKKMIRKGRVFISETQVFSIEYPDGLHGAITIAATGFQAGSIDGPLVSINDNPFVFWCLTQDTTPYLKIPPCSIRSIKIKATDPSSFLPLKYCEDPLYAYEVPQ